MPARLSDKVAIVTGGARGLGSAIAEVFCEEGACVMLGDVLTEEGAATAAKLRSKGGRAEFHALDVAREADWARIVSATVAKFGKLTTLVNNAGIFHPGGLQQETLESWERMISVDQTGVFLGMKTAMPALIDCGHGAIVNIASILGLIGTLQSFSYHAAKGAVRIMSKTAAVEFGPRNVRINSIYPGAVEAPSHRLVTDADTIKVLAMTPMGRKGVPRDVACAALFLCSDEAQFITGAELLVDGGMYAG
jgi:NAD(P)-dependent dehydrogenase (short-subunit alcohol dehydrogenase family)